MSVKNNAFYSQIRIFIFYKQKKLANRKNCGQIFVPFPSYSTDSSSCIYYMDTFDSKTKKLSKTTRQNEQGPEERNKKEAKKKQKKTEK